MTRAERAAEKVRKEKEKRADLERKYKEALAGQKADERHAELVLREETRKAEQRRRAYIGQLVQEAGLFVWSDTELAGLFHLLATLAPCPDPVAVLEGLLCPSVVVESERVRALIADGVATVIS